MDWVRSAAFWAAVVVCLGGVGAGAQQAVAVPAPSVAPLAKMPYSPSLDVASMDRTADPCTDFYKFVCGGWIVRNPIPADQAAWSVYAKLTNDNEQFLWGILEADAKAAQRTSVQQKVGDYFESCMNTGAIDAKGLGPMEPGLGMVAALKTREEIAAAVTDLDRRYPGSFFFRAGTGQDAVNSSQVIVELMAGGLGLPDRDYYTKTDARSVKIREQYGAFVTQMLGMVGDSPEQAKTGADAVLRIETALAKAQLTRVERRDPHKTYHIMTVTGLQMLAPAFRWEPFLTAEGAAGVARAECIAAGVYEGCAGGGWRRSLWMR